LPDDVVQRSRPHPIGERSRRAAERAALGRVLEQRRLFCAEA
jgi:hypothetical protein